MAPCGGQDVIREVFDLPSKSGTTPARAKRHKTSNDTLRRKALESARGPNDEPVDLEEASRADPTGRAHAYENEGDSDDEVRATDAAH